VLVYECAQCGFSFSLDDADLVGPLIVEGVRGVVALLAEADPSQLRERPDPQTWSAHEYACHLRDVFLVQRERVLLARREERPDMVAMGRDERVEHDGYASQETADVARQLGDAAAMFAHTLSMIDSAGWERTVVYLYPERAERTLRWVAAHTLHEVRHHTADMQSGSSGYQPSGRSNRKGSTDR